MFDSLLSLDLALFRSAQSLVPHFLAPLLRILGEGIVLWGASMLIVLWVYGRIQKDDTYKKKALQIGMTIVLTFILYTAINMGIPQWRPGAMEISGAQALIPHPTDNSFPSGHALFTGALIVALSVFFPKRILILFSLFFGLVTAFARVCGGVHYPGDILGGWIVGGVGAFSLTFCIVSAFFEKHITSRLLGIARFLHL